MASPAVRLWESCEAPWGWGRGGSGALADGDGLNGPWCPLRLT